MASKWSDIWSQVGFPRGQKAILVASAKYTAPAPVKKKVGGDYPSAQPFFKYKQQEKKAA